MVSNDPDDSQYLSPRDTQFSGFAKLLWDELINANDSGYIDVNTDYDDGIDPTNYRLIIARRVYDLAMFIVSQAYKEDLKPQEILCKDGKPILMYPENLKEWYEEKYENNRNTM